MGKEIAAQVQEVQRVPYTVNTRWNTTRNTSIKLAKIKNKDQMLKAAREKQQIKYKWIPIRITAHLSKETLQVRWEWQDILKMIKGKNLQLWLFYPARISFTFEWEIKKTSNKAKAESIQHHQTSSSINANGTSLNRKHRRGLFIKMKQKQ